MKLVSSAPNILLSSKGIFGISLEFLAICFLNSSKNAEARLISEPSLEANTVTKTFPNNLFNLFL